MWQASRLESPDLFFEHSFALLQREGLSTRRRRLCASKRACATTAGLIFRAALRPPYGAQHALLPLDDQAKARKSAKAPPRPPEEPANAYRGQPAPSPLTARGKHGSLRQDAIRQVLVSQLRGDKSRKKTAQEEVWRGRAEAPTGRGRAGHSASAVRAAAYSALIEAEKITRQRGSFSPGIVSSDMNFDGAKEIMYQGADINAYVQLRGACLCELDSMKTRTNYVNVMDGSAQARACSAFAIASARRAASGRTGAASTTGTTRLARPKDRRIPRCLSARASLSWEASAGVSRSGRPTRQEGRPFGRVRDLEPRRRRPLISPRRRTQPPLGVDPSSVGLSGSREKANASWIRPPSAGRKAYSDSG